MGVSKLGKGQSGAQDAPRSWEVTCLMGESMQGGPARST